MSTSGTAVGAKLESAKGNKRKTKYREEKGKHGKPGGSEAENRSDERSEGST